MNEKNKAFVIAALSLSGSAILSIVLLLVFFLG